jgi:hypothetical protein
LVLLDQVPNGPLQARLALLADVEVAILLFGNVFAYGGKAGPEIIHRLIRRRWGGLTQCPQILQKDLLSPIQILGDGSARPGNS